MRMEHHLLSTSVSRSGSPISRVFPPRYAREELFEFVRGLIPGSIPIKSRNWSGAVVIQRQDRPDYDAVYSVWATWIVPKVKPPRGAPPGEWRSASWVGLNGGNDARKHPQEPEPSVDVLQAGIDQIVKVDKDGQITETYQAWYAWDPGDDRQS